MDQLVIGGANPPFGFKFFLGPEPIGSSSKGVRIYGCARANQRDFFDCWSRRLGGSRFEEIALIDCESGKGAAMLPSCFFCWIIVPVRMRPLLTLTRSTRERDTSTRQRSRP